MLINNKFVRQHTKSTFQVFFKNWVEINDDSRGTYNTNSQINFKMSMLKPSLCDYSDPYILEKGTVTVTGAETCKRVKEVKKLYLKIVHHSLTE